MAALEKRPFGVIHESCCPPQFAFVYKPTEDLISFD
jgi:hypothetical protein